MQGVKSCVICKHLCKKSISPRVCIHIHLHVHKETLIHRKHDGPWQEVRPEQTWARRGERRFTVYIFVVFCFKIMIILPI